MLTGPSVFDPCCLISLICSGSNFLAVAMIACFSYRSMIFLPMGSLGWGVVPSMPDLVPSILVGLKCWAGLMMAFWNVGSVSLAP